MCTLVLSAGPCTCSWLSGILYCANKRLTHYKHHWIKLMSSGLSWKWMEINVEDWKTFHVQKSNFFLSSAVLSWCFSWYRDQETHTGSPRLQLLPEALQPYPYLMLFFVVIVHCLAGNNTLWFSFTSFSCMLACFVSSPSWTSSSSKLIIYSSLMYSFVIDLDWIYPL